MKRLSAACFISVPVFIIAFYVLLFSTINWFMTFLGASCIFFFKKEPKRLKEIALGSSSGLMIGATFFSLLFPAIELLQQQTLLLFFLPISFLLGAIFVKLIHHLLSLNNQFCSKALLLFLVMTIHNFPEGLAIGSGFEASLKLGLSLAIAICLHDIPEGISMAVPMKNGGMKISKVIFYVILSGITTGIGAFFGAIIGSISQVVISICLSFAAGAMLYIVSRRTYTRI